MLERPNAGDAGIAGMLAGCRGCWRGCWRLSGAICTVFPVFFRRSGNVASEARRKAREVGDVLGSKCLGRPVMQAMLRRSLGCNKTRQTPHSSSQQEATFLEVHVRSATLLISAKHLFNDIVLFSTANKRPNDLQVKTVVNIVCGNSECPWGIVKRRPELLEAQGGLRPHPW